MTVTVTLDEFTRAYIVAALWSTMDNSDSNGDDPLDKNYCVDDIAPETLGKIIADCEKFQRENASLITNCKRNSGTTLLEQAGHDFWLTRNHHGAGFWDGDWPEHGRELSQASYAYPEVDLYVGDDGRLYT